jgi:membrane-bound lytic murein transglycosylase B
MKVLGNNRFSIKSFLRILTLCIVAGVVLVRPSILLAADTRIDYVKRQLISAGINTTLVNALFADKRLKSYPIKSVSYKQPNWSAVEKKLFSQNSIQAGLNYIVSNKTIFDKAEQDFGVPKGVLAGIIAIETDFGKNSGSYSTFNALYSRVKQWPTARWKAQANELTALSKYCLNSKIDCFGIKGSYAGAFGLVQFMPSSLLAYGVDGDNDRIIDLSKPADAIPSAANFLKSHGWQQNQLLALAHYYGSSVGYPGIVLTYASLLTK